MKTISLQSNIGLFNTKLQAFDNEPTEEDRSFGAKLLVFGFLAIYAFINLQPVLDVQMNQMSTSGRPASVMVEEDGQMVKRGIYTKFSTGEMNRKLAAVPVFYVKSSAGGVALENGQGTFYTDVSEAEAAFERIKGSDSDAKVSTTALDEVYFSLIRKKIKTVGGLSSPLVVASDATATYTVVSPKLAMEDAAMVNKDYTPDGIPLFASQKLAFRDAEGRQQIPLFLSYQDLESTWGKLREANPKLSKIPEQVEVTGLNYILGEMASGGQDFRLLEFYPTSKALDSYSELIRQ